MGYELMASLTLLGDWTPIATYSGVFEGNGKTISGLTINADYGRAIRTVRQSWFRVGGEVRNVGVVGVGITVTTSDQGTIR